MSLREYQSLERYLADRPISENDQIDILDAYKAYFDACRQKDACNEALRTCELAIEELEYDQLYVAWSQAVQAVEIAWDNYRDIYIRLFR